jgi:hypothetical protein
VSVEHTIVPPSIRTEDILASTFSKKPHFHIGKREHACLLLAGVIEVIDARRRISRYVGNWKSVPSFSARTSEISLAIPSYLRDVLRSEITKTAMEERA